jgi:hypothetical protein
MVGKAEVNVLVMLSSENGFVIGASERLLRSIHAASALAPSTTAVPPMTCMVESVSDEEGINEPPS